jgi:hypothetical protein
MAAGTVENDIWQIFSGNAFIAASVLVIWLVLKQLNEAGLHPANNTQRFR